MRAMQALGLPGLAFFAFRQPRNISECAGQTLDYVCSVLGGNVPRERERAIYGCIQLLEFSWLAEGAHGLTVFIGIKAGIATVAGIFRGARLFPVAPWCARRAIVRSLNKLRVPRGAVLAIGLTELVSKRSWIARVAVHGRIPDDVGSVTSCTHYASMRPSKWLSESGRAVSAITLPRHRVEGSWMTSFAMRS